MAIIQFPGNPQMLARRRWLAREVEAVREDLEAFGIHPARIRTLEELGRALTWVDARAHAEALAVQQQDPARIVLDAMAAGATDWCGISNPQEGADHE